MSLQLPIVRQMVRGLKYDSLIYGLPSWVHPLAVYADDYELGQYWRSQSGLVPPTDQLSTTRSSGIILPNMAGVYQTLGVNTLPRTDRGLYANGQHSRLNTGPNFNPSTATSFTSRNSAALDIVARESWPSAVEEAFASSPLRNLSVTSALRVTCPGAVVNEGVTFPGALPANTDGIASAFVFVESGAKPLIGLSTTAQVLSGQEVLGGFERSINQVASSASRVMAIATDHNVAAAASTFWVILQDLKAGTFATPPIAHPDTTILASDIRTVQGVRPSNGQAEPFPGWEAAGLDNGFTILIELETRVRNAATRRPVIFSGGTGAFRLETSTTGAGFRVYTSDGSLGGPTNFQGELTGGPSRAAARVQGSETATARQGYYSVSKAVRGFIQQPGALHIGNQSSLSAPWDDWIYELQICPPLSDAQLLEWVNA